MRGNPPLAVIVGRDDVHEMEAPLRATGTTLWVPPGEPFESFVPGLVGRVFGGGRLGRSKKLAAKSEAGVAVPIA